MTYSYTSIASVFDADGNRLVGAVFNGQQYVSGWFQIDIQIDEGYVDMWQDEDNYRLPTSGLIVDGKEIPETTPDLLEALAPFSPMGDEGEDVDWSAVSGNVFKNRHLTRNFVVANTNWSGYDGVDIKNTWKEVILSHPRTLDFDSTFLAGEATWRPYGLFFTDRHDTTIGMSLYGTNGNTVINGELQGTPQIDMRNKAGDYIIIRPGRIKLKRGPKEVEISVDDTFNSSWGDITGNITDQTDLIDYINNHSGGIRSITGGLNVNTFTDTTTNDVTISVFKLMNQNRVGFEPSTTNNYEWNYHVETVNTGIQFSVASQNTHINLSEGADLIALNAYAGQVEITKGGVNALLCTTPLSTVNTSQALLLRDLNTTYFTLNNTTHKIDINPATLIPTVYVDDSTITGDASQSNPLKLKNISCSGEGIGYTRWKVQPDLTIHGGVVWECSGKNDKQRARIVVGDGDTWSEFQACASSSTTYSSVDRYMSNWAVIPDEKHVPACRDFLTSDFWLPYTTGNTSNKIMINGANWKVKDIAAGTGMTVLNNNGTYTISYTGGSSGISAVVHDSTLEGDGTSTSQLKLANSTYGNCYWVHGSAADDQNTTIWTTSKTSAQLAITSTGGSTFMILPASVTGVPVVGYEGYRQITNATKISNGTDIPACSDFEPSQFEAPNTTTGKITLKSGVLKKSKIATLTYGTLLAGDSDEVIFPLQASVVPPVVTEDEIVPAGAKVLSVYVDRGGGTGGFVVANIVQGLDANGVVDDQTSGGGVRVEIWNIASTSCSSVHIHIAYEI